jgi:hypothetical protein
MHGGVPAGLIAVDIVWYVPAAVLLRKTKEGIWVEVI